MSNTHNNCAKTRFSRRVKRLDKFAIRTRMYIQPALRYIPRKRQNCVDLRSQILENPLEFPTKPRHPSSVLIKPHLACRHSVERRRTTGLIELGSSWSSRVYGHDPKDVLGGSSQRGLISLPAKKTKKASARRIAQVVVGTQLPTTARAKPQAPISVEKHD